MMNLNDDLASKKMCRLIKERQINYRSTVKCRQRNPSTSLPTAQFRPSFSLRRIIGTLGFPSSHFCRRQIRQ
uniref:Uncharacterized protein n=1 Tax=Fusarium oxysporum (strain Fo5176) TaxID=660025 RepID=A0A0D2XKH5_FUSOF